MGNRIGKLSAKRILSLVLSVVFAFGFVASIGEPVAAFGDGKFSEADYSGSNIWAYDPRVPLCSGTSSATSLVGTDNRQKIYNYWVSAGLSPAQAAGITGSLQAESGFSAFRQETTQTWPEGGYGIAQFTGGQRVAVTTALANTLGDTYTQNYIPKYGGGVTEATGFVPDGVSASVNDQFLLGELNYLNQYIASFAPSSIPARTSGLEKDYNLAVPSGTKLLDYIKTLTDTSDVAHAWTYLYEYPGKTKETAAARATNAVTILAKYSGGVSTGGGCNAGGAITCPGSSSPTIAAGDGSIDAIISTAKCITIQPPAGKTSSRDLGRQACDSGGCSKGPPSPAVYAAARRTFKTAGSSGTNDSFDNYGADCGNFIATVMRMSGADPSFPISGVSRMHTYMTNHPEKYEQIKTTSSTAGLQPGDILTEVSPHYDGHILMYLGNGQIAQASQGEEMPAQQAWWSMNGIVWRLKK